MDEKFRRNVRQFLTGTLNKKETLGVLDQVKKSEECRLYLEEQVRLSSASQKPHYAAPMKMSSHSCNSVQNKSSFSYPPLSNADFTGGVRQTRRGLGVKKTLMFGAILFAVMFFLRPTNFKDEDVKPLTAKDVLVAAALKEGAPVSTSPKGTCSSRPMSISAYLPPGNDQAKLVFLANGTPIFESFIRLGDLGVQMDTATVRGESGLLPAIDLILPFPDKTALPLEKGKRYFYFLELPNGRQSAPQSIDIR